MKVGASIDIGSNSVLLLVAESENGKLGKVLAGECSVTALGREIKKTGRFHPESRKETLDTLNRYAKIVRAHGIEPSEVVVTATEAARVACDSVDFFEQVHLETGLSVKIINAEGEAWYTALGVMAGARNFKGSSFTIMDIGGASTELTVVEVKPFSVRRSISLPMGSVVCSEWQKEGKFDSNFSEIVRNFPIHDYDTDHLVCVAGSMTSIAGMFKGLLRYSDNEVQDLNIGMAEFRKFFKTIEFLDGRSLIDKFPFLGKRASTIVAGARLGLRLGDILGVKSFSISTYGLRYGTLVEGTINEKFL